MNGSKIEFRGKTLRNNFWFYGDLVRELQTEKVFILDVGNTRNGEAKFKELGEEVDPKTVSPYTGLKDKNGKKVYENDIVLDWAGDKGIVKFGEWDNDEMFEDYRGGYGWYVDKDGDTEYDIHSLDENVEVIGNVHDGVTKEDKPKFIRKDAKENFHALLDYINENFEDDDPIAYFMRCGDVEVIDKCLEEE